MTTEEVFEELRTIVEKIDHCFSVYKHTDPDGLFYIGFCRNDPKQRWDYGGFSGERKTSLKRRRFITPEKLPKDLSAVLKRASCIQAHMKQEYLRGFAQAASLQYALAIIRQLTDTTGNICTKKGLVINKPVLFYLH